MSASASQIHKLTLRAGVFSGGSSQRRENHVGRIYCQPGSKATTLAEFIANRGSKAVDEAIQLAKEFAEARNTFKIGLKNAALNC